MVYRNLRVPVIDLVPIREITKFLRETTKYGLAIDLLQLKAMGEPRAPPKRLEYAIKNSGSALKG